MRLAAAVLWVAVASAACGRPGGGGLFERRTPRQQYLESLQSAGLGDSALVRDWLAAGAAALQQPVAATLPLNTDVEQAAAAPRAYGYRVQMQRGRVLRVELDAATTPPAIVFIELFLPTDLTQPIATSRRDELRLEYEIENDSTYILRIQPELLRGESLRIRQRTTAALMFPVSGRSAAAVKSFFLDPRDNDTRDHHGIDIFAPRNTPVVAAAGGVVTNVGTTPLGGKVVWIWDSRRNQSHYYAHLEQQAVSAGAIVRAGDVVGYVGNSGNARTTPPHLHFGIYSRREGPVNPLPFVAE